MMFSSLLQMIQNYPPVAYRIQNVVTDSTYVYKDVLKAVATTPQQEQNLAEATRPSKFCLVESSPERTDYCK